jgi:putative oxidoreductase
MFLLRQERIPDLRAAGQPSLGTEAGWEVAVTSLYASLEKWRPYVLSLLRIVAALLFLEEGLIHLFSFPVPPRPMTTLFYIQGVIETVGGLLLLFGAWSRPVAFILSGDMAVGYFMIEFPDSFYPAVNGGEAAILFCFVFLYIFFAGGGPWSVDHAVLKQD